MPLQQYPADGRAFFLLYHGKKNEEHDHYRPRRRDSQHSGSHPDIGLGIILLFAGSGQTQSQALSDKTSHRASILLAKVFAITWFISTAMAAHLPKLLQASGLTLAAAVAISALVGPAQVIARLMEFGLLRRVHPLLSAQLTTLAHPIGAVCLMIFAAPAAMLFTLLHGAGNGILTIAKGTLPLVIFGPQGYGLRQGLLMVPARIAQAGAPFLFGLLIEQWGAASLWVSGLLGLVAFAALLWLAQSMKPQS